MATLSRSDIILKYIVEYFVKTAQPVGSNTLIKEYNLNLSSATIRNEMFALEKMGYIEKLHTSGGRVPSTKGYRYYCDKLRDNAINDELKYSLKTVLDNKVQSIEEMLKECCEILSHMTNLVSVVVGTNEEEKLANVQLIKLSDKTLTAVFVTNQGYVENKTFIVPENISAEDMVKCVKILNDRLVGTKLSELTDKVVALKPVLSDYVISHDLIYQALLETFLRFASDRMNLYGKDELFNHPEFQNDSSKLVKVLKMLEDSSLFKNQGEILKDKPSLKIGEESGDDDLSMITTKISIGDNETSICLVGPKRMDYDGAMSALEYLAKSIEDKFGSFKDDDEDDKGDKDA